MDVSMETSTLQQLDVALRDATDTLPRDAVLFLSNALDPEREGNSRTGAILAYFAPIDPEISRYTEKLSTLDLMVLLTMTPKKKL